MAPKKGLSMEQKRQKMLELFHETQEVFQMKDLEKLGPSKGVIVQSVKEVVESLADDEMINREKIGGSWFYWSFLSDKAKAAERMAKETGDKVKKLREKRDLLKATLESMDEGEAGPEDEVKELQKEIQTLKDLDSQLDTLIADLEDCGDPEVHAKYEEDYKVACDAVSRWTSNVVSLRDFVTGKSNITEAEFNKRMNIKDDFEDIEF